MLQGVWVTAEMYCVEVHFNMHARHDSPEFAGLLATPRDVFLGTVPTQPILTGGSCCAEVAAASGAAQPRCQCWHGRCAWCRMDPTAWFAVNHRMDHSLQNSGWMESSLHQGGSE